MKLALGALIAIIGLVAISLSTVQPVSAQLAGTKCPDRGVSFTNVRYWHEKLNQWVLQEFSCTPGTTWAPHGGPTAYFGQNKPDSWSYTGTFDSRGFPRIATGDTSVLAKPPGGNTYWDTAVSGTIQKGLSKYVYAGDICEALKSGEVTGNSVDTAHVYRVGNAWHYIPEGDHRTEYGRPDARMSSIWGSVTSCEPLPSP